MVYSFEKLESAFKDLTITINRCLSWPTGWDGDGALDFSPATITRSLSALATVVNLCHQHKKIPDFEFFPGNDNSIELDITLGNKFLSLTVDSRCVYAIAHLKGNDAFDASDLTYAVNWLCQ